MDETVNTERPVGALSNRYIIGFTCQTYHCCRRLMPPQRSKVKGQSLKIKVLIGVLRHAHQSSFIKAYSSFKSEIKGNPELFVHLTVTSRLSIHQIAPGINAGGSPF